MLSMAMAEAHSLTPPAHDHSIPRHAGQRRMHPNAGAQYQQDYGFEDQYVPSGSTKSYNSPQPGPVMIDRYSQEYAQVEQGAWNFYDGHNEQNYPQYQDGFYPAPPAQYSIYPNPTMYGEASPAPGITDRHGGTRRVARQRKIISNQMSRSPSPARRRKAAKKENPKKSKLDKPLSQLTKHLDHIPIKDTATWVNRSLETRQQEKGSDGFIKRPSNSFILYRSAYADRCREYEKSNNHQDISSMAGASWAIETSDVRKQYEEWAKLERSNHQAAFPNYKFQPQTAEAKARKRKSRSDETSEEPSDAEDPTYHQRGDVVAARGKKPRRNFRESSYTPSLASQDEYMSPEPYMPAMQNSSHYLVTNPGKPLPAALGRLHPGGYYPTPHLPSNARLAGMGYVEDVRYRQADAPTSHYGTPPPVGLPGASHEDLMGDSSIDNGHLMISNAPLDPQLLDHDQGLSSYSDFTGPTLHNTGFQASDFLEERDQIAFDTGPNHSDAEQHWVHFDEGE